MDKEEIKARMRGVVLKLVGQQLDKSIGVGGMTRLEDLVHQVQADSTAGVTLKFEIMFSEESLILARALFGKAD